MKKQYSVAVLLLAFTLSAGKLAFAQQTHEHHEHGEEVKAGHSHAKAEAHGGEVVMTKKHHFEVVWMPDHVMVYLYDQSQQPLAAQGVTGEVTFKFKDGKTQTEKLTLMDVKKMAHMQREGGKEKMHEHEHGKMSEKQMQAMHERMSNQDHLMANVNLAGAEAGEVKATFTLSGLPGDSEKEVTFSSKYQKMKMERIL